MEEAKNSPAEQNVAQEANLGTYKQIIKNMLADGAKKFDKLFVKSVNVTIKDSHVMVSFTFKTQIPGYVSNDGIDYVLGKTSTIYSSMYAIVACMKENDEIGWAAALVNNKVNELLEDSSIEKNVKEKKISNILSMMFFNASITVLQREFAAGEPITNPFSTRVVDESELHSYDHDVLVNDIIDIKLGERGNKTIEKFADSVTID